jgi:DNA-binding response OmpR family regulator
MRVAISLSAVAAAVASCLDATGNPWSARARTLVVQPVRKSSPLVLPLINERPALAEVNLDTARRLIAWKGSTVVLTVHECLVIAALLANPGTLVARDVLERAVYGSQKVRSNKIEVLVHNLRRKLGRRSISGVRGRGYRLEVELAAPAQDQ